MKSIKSSMVFLVIAALFFVFSGCTEQMDNPFRTNDGGSSKELQEGKSEGAGKVTPSNQGDPWERVDIGQKNSSQVKKATGRLVICSYAFTDSKRCPHLPYWGVEVYRCHISYPYKCPESPDDCVFVYSYCYSNGNKK